MSGQSTATGRTYFSDFKFIEIAHWPIGQKWPNRNQVFTSGGFVEHFDNLKIGANPDLYNWYRSIHCFDVSFRDFVHRTGSVEKYEGEHILDAAVIESDGKDFTDAAKFIFDELLPRLAEWDIDQKQLLVDPSGNKGFHIEIPAGLFRPTPHLKLYKIHEFFIRALTKFPEGYYGQGQKIDTATYQICRLLRLRGTKNVNKDGVLEEHRGFKINLNGTLDSLKDDPSAVYNLWKNPNKEALSHDYLSGKWHWEQKPNSRLQDLWQECQSRVDNENRKRVFVPDSQRHPTKRRIKIGEVPDCLKVLEDMALSDPVKVKEQNLRNYITCALTTFYAEAGYSDAWVLAHVKGIMNSCIAPDFTLDEIETTVRTKLNGDNTGARYAFGCGRESGFPSCLHKYCSASGELKDCPTYKVKQEKKVEGLISVRSALDRAIADLNSGASPYFFGIPELDSFYGPLQPNDKVYVQAVQSSGKTLFCLGLFDNFAAIAKKQSDVLLFLSPEDNPGKLAKRWLITKAQLTLKQLYQQGGQNLSKEVLDWFERYDDTLYFWEVSKHSVGELSNAIDSASQTTGKKVAVVCYDGATLFRSENKFAKILEADIAQELARVIATKNDTRAIFNIHLPKAIAQEAKKEGKAENSARGGLSGGLGTIMYSITSQLLLSLYQDQGFIILKPEKAKERWDGNLGEAPEIMLAIDRYFRWYTLEKAMELINSGQQHLFEADVKATYTLREQRKRMRQNRPKILEIK